MYFSEFSPEIYRESSVIFDLTQFFMGEQLKCQYNNI